MLKHLLGKTEIFATIFGQDFRIKVTAVRVALVRNAMREKGLYSELFWSAFPHIRTEYGEILRISPCSVQMRENTDQNNSEYGQLLRSDEYTFSKSNF